MSGIELIQNEINACFRELTSDWCCYIVFYQGLMVSIKMIKPFTSAKLHKDISDPRSNYSLLLID